LIAAAFAAYFAILGAEHLEDKEFLAYLVSCIGLIFAWAWFLVNRGSKFWQENWENHVDMLEDEVIGPLYKTILHRPVSRKAFNRFILGPQAISVSKINLLGGLFTIVIWVILIFHSLPPFSYRATLSWRHLVVGIITSVFIVLMGTMGRTSLEAHEHVVTRRKTEIVRE
jgi:hypothetical protein